MIFEIFKRALASLSRNRTRTVLTLAGISWGVACFVILFAYGDGFSRAIEIGFAHYGKNITVIWNGQTSKQVGGQRAGRRVRMESSLTPASGAGIQRVRRREMRMMRRPKRI